MSSRSVVDMLKLSLPYEDPRSPIHGLERNPDHVPLACANCIGACCIGSPIAHMNHPGEGQRLAQGHGFLHQGFFPEHFNGIATNPYGPTSIEKVITYGPTRAVWIELATKAIEGAASSPHNNVYRACGSCGELTPNGRCACHDGDRPSICVEAEVGGPFCQERFVALGSPAARRVSTVLNKALPTICTVRKLLGFPHGDQKPFDFQKF
jgi:hypothetical protein